MKQDKPELYFEIGSRHFHLKANRDGALPLIATILIPHLTFIACIALITN